MCNEFNKYEVTNNTYKWYKTRRYGFSIIQLPGKSMDSIRILVVEDQPSARGYICDELRKAGYSAIHDAESVEHAIALFSEVKPDIVLMDINLGEKMDGIDLSRKLKDIHEVPIIYTTAYADAATIIKARDTTPDGYLVKPFDKQDLYSAIEIALYKNNIYQQLLKTNRQLEQEISARKKTEEKLLNSESRYKQLLNGITESVFIIDRDWKYGPVNESAASLGGLSSHEMTGKSLHDVFPDVENSNFYKAYEHVMKTELAETVEDEYVLPDGKKGWFEVKIYPVPEGILCIASDISERKQAELAVAENEEKYRSFIHNSLDAFALTDETGTVIEWNRSQEELSGINAEQALGKKIWEVHSLLDMPDKVEKINAQELERNMQDFFSTGTSHFLDVVRETSVVNAHGEIREMQQKSFKIETPHGFRLGSVSRDITQLKRTLTALKETEERFHLLSDVTFEGIVLHKNGIPYEVNKSFTRITGYSRGEVIGKNIIDLLVVEQDKESIRQNIIKDYALPYVVRVRKRDGSVFHAEIEARNMTYKEQEVRIAAIRDVSKKIEAESKLKESEEKFRTLVENANDLLFTVSPQGMFTYMSPNCLEITGRSVEEYIGSTIFDFLHPEDISSIQALLRQAILSGKKVSNIEYRIQHKNGYFKWLLANGSPLFDSEGNLSSFIGIAHDVTARKNAEFLLKKSEEQNRSIIEALPEIMIELTADGIFTTASTSNPEQLFLPPEQFLNKNIRDVMPPEFANLVMKNVKAALDEKNLQVFEYFLEMKGSIRYFEARMNPKGDSHVISLLSDVTDRKNAEFKLKASEEQFKSLFENSNDAIFIHDSKGTVIDVNHRACEMLGYDRNTLIDKDISWFVHPSLVKTKETGLNEVKKKGYAYIESTFVNKNQKAIHVEISASMFDKENRLIQSIVRDITKRKETEKQLASLAAIIENSNNIAVIKDLDLRVIATNRAFVKAAGKSRVSELIGKTDAEIFEVSPGIEPVKTYMEDDLTAQTLRKGEKIIREEPVFYPDGEERIVLTTKFPVFDQNDKVIATANISTDITKHKKTLERLKMTLKYSESLAECSHYFMSGRKDSLNLGLKQILKASEASRVYVFENFEDPEKGLSMRQIHEVVQPGIRPEINNPVLQQLPYSDGFDEWKNQLARGDIINGSTDQFAPDVREILQNQGIKSILILPIFIKSSWFGFIGFDDVETERKWHEQDMKLLRTVSDVVGFYLQNRQNEQKMLKNNQVLQSLNSSKDKMMSIIGHDLKNPVGQVMGFVDLLIHNYDKYDEKKIKYFHHIIYSSIQQVSALLDNLLQWSRSERGKIQFHPEVFNASLTAESTVSLLEAVALNKNISLINNLDKDIWVHADVNMIDTVWRNLVSNAIKFTEKGGNIILNYQVEGDFIRFSVTDTGIGIRKEIREKIFEVDHSVSTSGTSGEVGTGLGLNICKEFVERHGGEISVESEPGKGSTFFFTLPKGS